MNDQSRIFDFLDYQLNHFPKKDMFCGKENGQWTPYSTADVKDIVNRLSAGLVKLGLSGHNMQIEQQDKVALISKNRPEWLMLDLACQQIGVALCPIYPTTNINELEFIFNDAAVKYVFVSGQDILDKVTIIRERVPSLSGVFSFDELAGAEYWKTILNDHSAEDLAKLETTKASIRPGHCATIIYTSGTTGTPKGVMLSHRNIVSNVLNSVNSF
ncbi:MAG TPA: AMP-binding protein, partial [Ferruginibacter sp.]|nr:AMP-binding protein [Ferruginibacter sp.]